MAGSRPPRKRLFRRQGRPEAHDAGSGAAEGAATPSAGGAPPSVGTGDSAGPRWTSGALPLDLVKHRVRKGRKTARAGLGHLVDRVIENAPRVPVRDLATLRRQFPGLGPEQLADKLVAGAANATSTVGAGIGAAAMLPVPPAMPAELAAEIIGVASIELKLVAELHEVYGQRPPGNLKQRATAYLDAWSDERGIEVSKPSTFNTALGNQLKHQLRQQIMKRMVRNLPNLMPFMVGAAVGALINRRDTKKLAEKIRDDLRSRQVPWDALVELPPLEQPEHPLTPAEFPKELGR